MGIGGRCIEHSTCRLVHPGPYWPWSHFPACHSAWGHRHPIHIHLLKQILVQSSLEGSQHVVGTSVGTNRSSKRTHTKLFWLLCICDLYYIYIHCIFINCKIFNLHIHIYIYIIFIIIITIIITIIIMIIYYYYIIVIVFIIINYYYLLLLLLYMCILYILYYTYYIIHIYYDITHILISATIHY
jgi:hypothetical protein